jgi:hypothetical protein
MVPAWQTKVLLPPPVQFAEGGVLLNAWLPFSLEGA